MQKLIASVLGTAMIAMLVPVTQPRVEDNLPAYHLKAVKFFESMPDPQPATELNDERPPEPAARLVSILQDRPASKGPTFPTLASELASKPVPLKGEAAEAAKAEAARSDTPKAEIEAEPAKAMESAGATGSDSERLDRLERAMSLLVTVVSRSHQLTPDEANQIAKAKLSQPGKVEVSESGTVTVDKVQSTPIQTSVQPVIMSSDANCDCEPAAYSGGSTGSRYGSSYSGGSTGSRYGSSYAATTYSGGSTGSYQTSYSGGSTGSYSATNYQPAVNQNAAPKRAAGLLSGMAERREERQTQRAAQTAATSSQLIVTPPQSNYAAQSDCRWFLGADGNWYKVCDK